MADLWSDALRAYKGIVGTDLQRKFATVDDMKAFGVQEMNAFHSFRHNQKKVDKLRSLFMANIGYIEQGAQQLVAAATPAFPPAAAIGTALTYMLSACKGVSADYDVSQSDIPHQHSLSRGERHSRADMSYWPSGHHANASMLPRSSMPSLRI